MLTFFQIVRVQNPKAYELYMIEKKHVSEAIDTTKWKVERSLWHGTTEESIKKIIISKFDRVMAGKNGKFEKCMCFFYIVDINVHCGYQCTFICIIMLRSLI